jgi:rubredoxin-NAD+ reductase
VASRPIAACAPAMPSIYALGDCAEVEGKVLLYVLPLMAAARAFAKTLTGTDTPVQYPAMPVQIKTPACPVIVAPVMPGTAGRLGVVEADGNDVKAVYSKRRTVRCWGLP